MFLVGTFQDYRISKKLQTIPSLLNVFVIKGNWILLKVFSVSIEAIIHFFPLHSVDVTYHIDQFLYVEPSLHSNLDWKETTTTQ